MKTNAIFTLIALALLTSRLLNDFKKDEGQNKKAKLFQSILLGLLVLSYARSVRSIGWLFRHYDDVVEKFTVDVGIVPGHIHFKIFMLSIVLMLTTLVLAFLMAGRNQKARQLLFFILPFLALVETFNFYRGWLSMGEEELNHGFIFLIGFIIMGGITAFILSVYNLKFMQNFFNFKEHDTPQENNKQFGPESE